MQGYTPSDKEALKPNVDFSLSCDRADELSVLVDDATLRILEDRQANVDDLLEKAKEILLEDREGLQRFERYLVATYVGEHTTTPCEHGLGGTTYKPLYTGEMGLAGFKTRIKGAGSVFGKAGREERNFQMKDLSAGRFICEDWNGVYSLVERFKDDDNLEIVGHCHKHNPDTGYEAEHLKVKFSDGKVREVQVLTIEKDCPSEEDDYHAESNGENLSKYDFRTHLTALSH